MRIELLGSAFTIQSDEDPDYLRQVVQYFSDKIDEVSRSVATSDPLKISILAGILASDEYLKSHAEDPRLARITEDLIATLVEILDAPTPPLSSEPGAGGDADSGSPQAK